MGEKRVYHCMKEAELYGLRRSLGEVKTNIQEGNNSTKACFCNRFVAANNDGSMNISVRIVC